MRGWGRAKKGLTPIYFHTIHPLIYFPHTISISISLNIHIVWFVTFAHVWVNDFYPFIDFINRSSCWIDIINRYVWIVYNLDKTQYPQSHSFQPRLSIHECPHTPYSLNEHVPPSKTGLPCFGLSILM